MKRKILFIEPSDSKTNFFLNVNQPLLGPIYMATQLHQYGYDVNVIKEGFVDSETFSDSLKHADIIIVTMLTNNAKRGYEIAEEYKKMRPDGWSIAGGIHVSFMPDEAAEYFDQVAVGEGTLIIKDLVDRKIKDNIVKGPSLENLDLRPIPDFSLFKNAKKLKRIPVMTSLGCPYGCTFCCVTKMYGKRYRFQSPEKTISELKQHFSLFGKKQVFFYDDNFCANKKNSLELFRKIKNENLNFSWSCQVRADLAKDEEFVKKMSESGCYRVYIGFESINEKTLNELKKGETLQEIENAISIFQRYGITIHGMFIFGADNDDINTFIDTAEFCKTKGIEHAQFFSITLFPGTDLFNSLEESRFIHKDWDIMDGFHANMVSKKLTQYQLIQGVLLAHEIFYSWHKIIKQLMIDFSFIFGNQRSLKYRILKLLQNLQKNIGFRIMIKKWKKNHKDYHQSLKDKHEEELKNKELKTAIPFKNYHISS